MVSPRRPRGIWKRKQRRRRGWMRNGSPAFTPRADVLFELTRLWGSSAGDGRIRGSVRETSVRLESRCERLRVRAGRRYVAVKSRIVWLKCQARRLGPRLHDLSTHPQGPRVLLHRARLLCCILPLLNRPLRVTVHRSRRASGLWTLSWPRLRGKPVSSHPLASHS